MRVTVECGNRFGDNVNLGDLAMYRALAVRLRRCDPDVDIRVVTDRPGTVAEEVPGVTPVRVGEGEAGDLLVVSGGGSFTDAFSHHARSLLDRLRRSIDDGRRNAIVGTGFEGAVTGVLLTAAAETLPNVDVIGSREGVIGPWLLDAVGVAGERVVVTGDDALELVWDRPVGERRAIGAILRAAPYAGIDDDHVNEFGAALNRLAADLRVEVRALGVSIDGPNDVATTCRALGRPETEPLGGVDDLIERISGCRLVVTGSYHGAVLALGQGVPVVAVAGSSHYAAKFAGLQERFGDGCAVVDLRAEPARRLEDSARALWSRAEAFEPALRAAAAAQVEAGRAVVAQVMAGEPAPGTRRRRAAFWRRPVDRPAPPVAGMRARFLEEGVIGPFNLLDAGRLAEVRRTFDGDVLAHDESQWAQRHLDLLAVHDLCTDSVLVATMQALQGPQLQLWNSRFRVKRPGDAMIPWHQDDAYWLLDPPTTTVSAWIALDDADEANGCLEVLPGSHRTALAHGRTDAVVHDDFHLTTVVDGAPPHARRVPMRAGQVLFFSSKLVHRSSANTGATRRAALVVRYAPTPVRFVEPPVESVLVVSGSVHAARHEVAPAPTGSATPTAGDDFRFEHPFRGGGWHARERAGHGAFCWTGAADEAWLEMAVPSALDAVQVRMEIRNEIEPGAANGASIMVDGTAFPTVRNGDELVSGPVSLPPGADTVRVTLTGVVPRRPCDLDDGNADRRPLGVAIGRVRLVAICN